MVGNGLKVTVKLPVGEREVEEEEDTVEEVEEVGDWEEDLDEETVAEREIKLV